VYFPGHRDEGIVISSEVSCNLVPLIVQTADERVELLVREYAEFVFRVAYSVLRDHHEAEDAVQETFLRVFRHRSKLAEILAPRAWLARIAFRIALNRYKSRRGETDDSAKVLAGLKADGLPQEEIVHRKEVKALLAQLIATLPADLRDVLRLSAVEELTSVEIGDILKIPENSVRTRLYRARRILKGKFKAVLGTTYGQF
jgi:RNA polymerase sigma-70 factor (ECF subfamily)